MSNTIRLGILGLGRGMTFTRTNTAITGLELVAICDTWESQLKKVGSEHGIATYTDFDEFLTHDMDAVILANYFHQHAPFAIKALKAGKHVLSETAACMTAAEGAQLIRAVEASGLTYMLGDQYPFMVFNQEMRRRYRAGEIGKFVYGEGEYVHPMSAEVLNSISIGVDHWRNWLPVTYYVSHSLAPLMYITGTTPVSVSSFVIPHDPDDSNRTATVRRMDMASAIMCEMDNGALVKLLQYDLRGEGIWVRVHGNRGQMENLRQTAMRNWVRVRHEPWDKAEGEPEEVVVQPVFAQHHEEAVRSGHSGSDFFMNYAFAEAIRTGEPPFFDVYRGVAMALVGNYGWRSALDDSRRFLLPNLRDPESLDAMLTDHWTPDPAKAGPGQPPASVLGDVPVSADALAYAEQVWAEQGGGPATSKSY